MIFLLCKVRLLYFVFWGIFFSSREIATMSYRSGPEWNQRFRRDKIDPLEDPSLCPTFTIESYLEYQGESFSTKFDPNSLLYLSKVTLFFLS